MSASLVGSEMCIRDRYYGWLLRASLEDGCSRYPIVPKTRYLLHVANAAPVSYTHLTLPTICSV
eukprot:15375352-Alexandrium_andersonii.AAC.1